MRHVVFYVSDSTAITAKGFGRGLLSQFKNLEIREYLRPYVNTPDKIRMLIAEINTIKNQEDNDPIIFVSIMNDDLRDELSGSLSEVIDIFKPFISSLEKTLKKKSSKRVGQAHSVNDDASYKLRIESIDFTLATDDGLKTSNYANADLILLGVSRSGKTPTALYLALNFGLKVANFPFTSEDLPRFSLNSHLDQNRDKLFGLLISPERLTSIRKERRSNGLYAEFLNVSLELEAMKELYEREKIPHIDTSTRSVEEIAATIVGRMRIGEKNKNSTPKEV